MIKYLLLFVLTTGLISCKQEKFPTFQEGLDSCNKITELENLPPKRVNCLEGFQLPEFTSITHSGETIDTRDLLGKPTVIDLWFIGCVPCELEIPSMNYLGDKYKDKVNFIAIGRNSKEELEKYLSTQQKWNFIHINDPNTELLDKVFHHDWGYPTKFIADKNGVIRKASTGGAIEEEQTIAGIEPMLVKLLAE